MNKKLGIIVGVIILILIGGAAVAFMNTRSTGSTPEAGKPGGSKSNIFSSIQDALSKNLVLKCDIKTPEGSKTTTYIKAGKIRVDTTGKTADAAGSVIMKDNKMYFWNDQGGFMMEFNLSDIEKNTQDNAQQTNVQDPKEYLSMIEKYKDSCSPAAVDDSLFVPPANVKFQDLSKLIKAIPSGANSSGAQGVNQTQIEELMKQYSQPQE